MVYPTKTNLHVFPLILGYYKIKKELNVFRHKNYFILKREKKLVYVTGMA